jgi:hypothetical protein
MSLVVTPQSTAPTSASGCSKRVSDGNRDGNTGSRQHPAPTPDSQVLSQNLSRTGHPLHLKSHVCPGGDVARARKSGMVRRGAGLGLLPPGGAGGGFRCWQGRGRLKRAARSRSRPFRGI